MLHAGLESSQLGVWSIHTAHKLLVSVTDREQCH